MTTAAEVQVGDVILDGVGRFDKVISVRKISSSRITTILFYRNNTPLICGDETPIRVKHDRSRKAKELKKHDWILLPTTSGINIQMDEIDLQAFFPQFMVMPEQPDKVFHSHKSKVSMNRCIKLDSDVLRLCGYFLSEGCVSSYTRFSFNISEKRFMRDAIRIINQRLGVSKTRIDLNANESERRLVVYGKVVCDFFSELFGNYSHQRKIPFWILMLPPNQLKNLMVGMVRGDGYLVLEGDQPKMTYITISKSLGYQAAYMFWRLGYIASLHRYIPYQKDRSRYPVYRILITGNDAAELSRVIKKNKTILPYKKSRRKNRSEFQGHYLSTQIRKIKSQKKKGKLIQIKTVRNNGVAAELASVRTS